MLLLREKRCVVSLHVGQGYDAIADITVPRMRKYAARAGADFHLITSQKLLPKTNVWQYVVWEKYQMADLIDAYPALLFLDLDCWVDLDCPDIFDFYAQDGFVATKFDSRPTFGPYARFCGLQKSEYEINSGVMLLRRSHRTILSLPAVFPPPMEYVLSEQDWWAINAQLQGLQVTPLHYMFHRGGKTMDFPFWIFHAVWQKENKVERLKTLSMKRALL